MVRTYLTKDPLAASQYKVSVNPARRFEFVPTNPVEAALKPVLRSRPFESYNDFINRIGFKEVAA